MKPISTTAQRQQLSAASALPASHFTRAGGTELSAAEHQLVEDFRLMTDASRAAIARVVHKQACRDREQRVTQNTAGLRLVGGGS